MPVIELPDGTRVEFPEGMDPQVARMRIAKQFAGKHGLSADAGDVSGVMGDIKGGILSGLSSVFAGAPGVARAVVGGDWKNPWLQRYERDTEYARDLERASTQKAREESQRAAEKAEQEGGFLSGFGEAVKQNLFVNPRLAALSAVQSAPGMLFGAGIGGLGARAAGGSLAARSLAAKVGAVGSESVLEGAESAKGTYDAVYERAIKQGMTEAQAGQIAASAAIKSGAASTGVTAALGALPLPTAETLLARRIAGVKSPVGGRLAGAGVGVAGEVPTEMAQAVTGVAGMQRGLQEISPEEPLFKGAGVAAGQAAATAGLIGGGTGLLTSRAKDVPAGEVPPAAEAPPGEPTTPAAPPSAGPTAPPPSGPSVPPAPSMTPEERAERRNALRAEREAILANATPEEIAEIKAIGRNLNPRTPSPYSLNTAAEVLERIKQAQEQRAAGAVNAPGSVPPVNTGTGAGPSVVGVPPGEPPAAAAGVPESGSVGGVGPSVVQPPAGEGTVPAALTGEPPAAVEPGEEPVEFDTEVEKLRQSYVEARRQQVESEKALDAARENTKAVKADPKSTEADVERALEAQYNAYNQNAETLRQTEPAIAAFETAYEKVVGKLPTSKEAGAAVQAGEYGKLIETLKKSPNRFARWVANKAENIAGIKLSAENILAAGQFSYGIAGNGVRTPDARNVKMYPSEKENTKTLTHELVHAITSEILKDPNPSQKPVVRKVEELFNAVKDHPLLRNQYGLANIREFVAEGLSNADFQRRLMAIPYKNTSAWGRFTQLVANLLGVRPQDQSAFTEVINLSEQLAQEKGKEEAALTGTKVDPSQAGKTVTDQTIAQTNTPAFKKWFGDSKVVGKDGKPLVVYHGMPSPMEGAVFRPSSYGSLGEGIYFTSDPAAAGRFATGERPGESPKQQGNVLPVYLRIEQPFDDDFFANNPKWQAWLASSMETEIRWATGLGEDTKYVKALQDKLNAGKASLREVLFDERGKYLQNSRWGNILTEAIKKHGAFDGIILKDSPKGFDEYLAFKPDQIKSAIGNKGTFSTTRAEIDEAPKKPTATTVTDQITTQTNTPAFKQWFGNSKVIGKDGKPLILYTGTSKDVDFSKFKIPKNGAWFTDDPKMASEYAIENDSKNLKYNPDTRRYEDVNSASRVMPVYLRIENPATLSEEDSLAMNRASNYRKVQGQIFDRLRAKGFDGVDLGGGVWVALGAPNQVKSAIGNKGTFSTTRAEIDEAPKKPRTAAQIAATNRMVLSKAVERAAKKAQKQEETRRLAANMIVLPDSRMEKLRRNFQNVQARLYQLSDAVKEKMGGFLPPELDLNSALILSVGEQQTAYDINAGALERRYEAVIEKYAKALKISTADAMRQLSNYMIALHELERRRSAFYERGADLTDENEIRRQFLRSAIVANDKELVKLKKDFKAGIKTPEDQRIYDLVDKSTERSGDLFDAIVDLVNNDPKAAGLDFNASTYDIAAYEGPNGEEVKMSVQEREEILKEMQDRFSNATIKDAVKEAIDVQKGIDQAIQDMNKSGDYTSKGAERLMKARNWQNYVPLRGKRKEDLDFEYYEESAGKSLGSSEGVFAGRSSLADNVITRSLVEAMKAAGRAPGNRTASILQNYVKEGFVQGKISKTPLTTLDNYVLGKKAGGPENVVLYRDPEGDVYSIEIADENLVAAIQAKTANLNPATNILAVATREMAQAHTRLNPKFWLKNFFVDAVTNSFKFTAEYGLKAGGQYTVNVLTDLKDNGFTRKSMKFMKLYAERDFKAINELAERDAWYRDALEYVTIGGRVSYLSGLRNETKMDEMYKKLGPNKVVKNYEQLKELVDPLVEGLELASRVSAYRTAKQLPELQGDNRKAAAYAKNLANFEQIGYYGKVMGAWFMFSRPSTTGAFRLYDAFTKGKYGKQTALGAMAMGASIYGMSMMLSGDDDDGRNRVETDDPARWVRNWRIFIPGKKDPIQIPWGFGFGAFGAASAQLAMLFSGNSSLKDFAGNMKTIAAETSGIPVSQMSFIEHPFAAILDSITPSIAKPILQMAVNVDALGRPVFQKGQSKYVDGYLGGESVPAAVKYISEGLFDALNDVLPASLMKGLSANSLDFIAKNYLGGVYGTINQIDSNLRATGIFTETPQKDLSFIKSTILLAWLEGSAANYDYDQYDKIAKEVSNWKQTLRTYKDTNPDKYVEYLNEHPGRAQAVQYFDKETNSRLRDLRAQANKIKLVYKDSPGEREEALKANREYQNAVMRQMTERIKQMTED